MPACEHSDELCCRACAHKQGARIAPESTTGKRCWICFAGANGVRGTQVSPQRRGIMNGMFHCVRCRHFLEGLAWYYVMESGSRPHENQDAFVAEVETTLKRCEQQQGHAPNTCASLTHTVAHCLPDSEGWDDKCPCDHHLLRTASVCQWHRFQRCVEYFDLSQINGRSYRKSQPSARKVARMSRVEELANVDECSSESSSSRYSPRESISAMPSSDRPAPYRIPSSVPTSKRASRDSWTTDLSKDNMLSASLRSSMATVATGSDDEGDVRTRRVSIDSSASTRNSLAFLQLSETSCSSLADSKASSVLNLDEVAQVTSSASSSSLPPSLQPSATLLLRSQFTTLPFPMSVAAASASGVPPASASIFLPTSKTALPTYTLKRPPEFRPSVPAIPVMCPAPLTASSVKSLAEQSFASQPHVMPAQGFQQTTMFNQHAPWPNTHGMDSAGYPFQQLGAPSQQGTMYLTPYAQQQYAPQPWQFMHHASSSFSTPLLPFGMQVPGLHVSPSPPFDPSLQTGLMSEWQLAYPANGPAIPASATSTTPWFPAYPRLPLSTLPLAPHHQLQSNAQPFTFSSLHPQVMSTPQFGLRPGLDQLDASSRAP